MSVPSRDDFFYVLQDSYDDVAELSLPHYQEAHDLIADVLRERAAPARAALDLGTGSGKTALTVLEVHPDVRLTAVDLFPEMLAHGRRRLSPFEAQVDFVESDNTAFLGLPPTPTTSSRQLSASTISTLPASKIFFDGFQAR